MVEISYIFPASAGPCKYSQDLITNAVLIGMECFSTTLSKVACHHAEIHCGDVDEKSQLLQGHDLFDERYIRMAKNS